MRFFVFLPLLIFVTSCRNENAAYETAAQNLSNETSSVENVAVGSSDSGNADVFTNYGMIVDGGANVIDTAGADVGGDISTGSISNVSETGGLSSHRLSPSEVIFCDILQDRVSRSDCNYFGQIWSSLSIGAGAFDAPEEMMRGETRTVSFVVTRNEAVSPKELLGSEPDEQFKLRIARRMAALLQGEGFTIHPKTIQYQDLFIGEGARWDWQITALKASRHSLSLSAYVVVASPDGKQKENLLKTVTRKIPVKVTWGQWYDDSVESITSSTNRTTILVVALAALFSALINFRKAIGAFLRSIFRNK